MNSIQLAIEKGLGLLPVAQIMMLSRFLNSRPLNGDLEYDLLLWAKGIAPYPNLTVLSWPG